MLLGGRRWATEQAEPSVERKFAMQSSLLISQTRELRYRRRYASECPAFEVNEPNPYTTTNAPSSENRAPSEFRRNLFWYGLGIWTLAVLSSILATIFATDPERFENPVGIAMMAFFAGPFIAVIFGAAYAGWIKIRASMAGLDTRVPFLFSIIAGLISIPIWIAIIGLTVETLGFIGEAVSSLCFAGMLASVMLLGEISLQLTQWRIRRLLQSEDA